MSREIKFRAWLQGKHKGFDFGEKGEMKDADIIEDGKYACEYIDQYSSSIVKIDNIPLMQYTGLTDKNSIEIYEGDVVEAKTVERSPIAPDYVSGYLKGVIEYYDNAFCIKYKDKKGQYIYNHLWTNAEEWRVLGNIHEHPHLMEEQQ